MILQPLNKLRIFSAFTLKILACVFMAIDHIGVRMYPEIEVFRILGRLAFPIFAYFIAEGCRYTKNRPKRFFSVFLLGVLCEAFYIIYSGGYYGNILITFSISILLIYCLQTFKKALNSGKILMVLLCGLLFAAAVFAAYSFCRQVGTDYGFSGVMVPVAVALFDYKEGENPEWLRCLDKRYVKLILLCLALISVALELSSFKVQWWSLAAIAFIALYNGRVGRFKLKSLFYVFYPAHLAAIELAAMLMNI